MQEINPMFYAYLISADHMPFLDRINDLDPAYAKVRPLYLDFADLSARSTWSVFSPENSEQGIPNKLWLVEGSCDVREIEIFDQPYGVAVEHIITPTSSHLIVSRKHPDKDVFVLYRGVAKVAEELASRHKPGYDAFLAAYFSGSPQAANGTAINR